MGGLGPPRAQEVPGPHEGSDLVLELVLALPRLGGDRAVELFRESVITKHSLTSGLEKQTGPITGVGQV